MKQQKNHGFEISKRMRENYDNILDVMTPEELAWAEKFEQMEYDIERGYGAHAAKLAKELNPSVSDTSIARIREDVTTKERCNPAKAESFNTSRKNKRTGKRSENLNLYDPYDWVRHNGTTLDDDGEETERGVTISAEDALIEALDAARAHNVSLDEFINDPKYHTPDRKPGRPKKLEIV